jgi:hypothetical protein
MTAAILFDVASADQTPRLSLSLELLQIPSSLGRRVRLVEASSLHPSKLCDSWREVKDWVRRQASIVVDEAAMTAIMRSDGLDPRSNCASPSQSVVTRDFWREGQTEGIS